MIARPRTPGGEGERGYALVAAVASIAVFAGLALSLMLATRAATVTAIAEIDRAKAAAAADAGLALALHHLLASDPAARWSLDGGDRRLRVDDAAITVRIEDERGKVPLARIDEAMAERLLARAGLAGGALAIARDSLLDWLDEDDAARPDGAEAAWYAARGLAPRNGTPLSIGELVQVRGFDPALVERLRPLLTVSTGQQSFDPTHADPAAIEIMQGDEGAVTAIERARELAGQRPAADAALDASLVGRPLTIAVLAVLPDGARAQRREMVELTGAPLRPYTVLSFE